MVAIGLLFFAGAIGAATALVLPDRGQGAVPVHVFDHTLWVQAYSIMAAGAAIAVIALIGLAMMRSGARRARRLRDEVDSLRTEHARLTGRDSEPEPSFFFETFPEDRSDEFEPPPPMISTQRSAYAVAMPGRKSAPDRRAVPQRPVVIASPLAARAESLPPAS